MRIGTALQALMKQRGMTQSALSRATGGRLSQTTIWKLVHDYSSPTTPTLEILADAFTMPFIDFLSAVGIVDDTDTASARVDQESRVNRDEALDEIADILVQLLQYRRAIAPLATFLRDCADRGILVSDDPEFFLQSLEDLLILAKREARAERRQREAEADAPPGRSTSAPPRVEARG